MNNKSANFVIFVIGATIGSVVTWQYIKQKYERFAQDEIDSVVAYYKEKPKKAEDSTNLDGSEEKVLRLARDAKEKSSITDYTNRYSEKKNEKAKPYVISPEEFGASDEYEKIGLTYYADKVLVDDNDEPVVDMEDIVGSDSLNHFGEYEDDSVFVRNERLKCDYEILLDLRKYSDLVKLYQTEE